MRTLITLALLATSTAAAAQTLPDAPSAMPAGERNSLPILNGRHYRPPTAGEQLRTLERRVFGVGPVGGSLFSATIQFARDRPDPLYWNTDAAGFGKRFGAAYGQRVINAGTRYTLGALLHEDNRYILCHACSLRSKLANALLADVTARRGPEGHRVFSPTGIAAGMSGSLVAYAFWYPNQDPDYTIGRGARNALIGFGTRPATHFALELLDGRRIPFTHRHIGDNSPSVAQQVPLGWTGPLPPRHRSNPELADTPAGYAVPAVPPNAPHP